MIVYQTRMHPYAQVLRRGTNILRDVSRFPPRKNGYIVDLPPPPPPPQIYISFIMNNL